MSEVILPWFQAVAQGAWRDPLPSAVVLPSRSLAGSIRAQLLARGVPLLGVHFLSPGQLRARLLRDRSVSVPRREHLLLLLSIAAEQCRSLKDADSASAAQSVARAPEHLLRAIEKLGTAGSEFTLNGSREIYPIVQRFERLVSACGFTLAHSADAAAPGEPHRLGNLLIAGFDGAHWPHWFLLLAAAKSASNTTVLLNDPQFETHDLDAVWNGSWEQEFGPTFPLTSRGEQLSLFDPVVEKNAIADKAFHFVVGRDTGEQAEAIFALTLVFLAEDSCRRIGLLFPEAGALPRLVAAALARGGIEHHDTFAQLAPGPFEDAAWSAWLALQHTPGLQSVIAFFSANPDSLESFRGLTSARVSDILRRVFDEILIDDLDLLRELCAARAHDRDALAVAAALSGLRVLPSTATLAGFAEITVSIFVEFGWHERAIELARATAGWSDAVENVFSRGPFLRWLAEVSSSFARVREDPGDHPYSRVQLLLYPQAIDGSWSHLIFCGSNEGAWPPRTTTAAYVSHEEIADLNTLARQANRRAVQQGNQGEGHLAVRPGKALFLGGKEEREIAARQSESLLESTDVGVGFAATLYDESAPARVANPNELFARLYLAARGETVSEQLFVQLQQQTRNWLAASHSPAADASSNADIRQTRVAYGARRLPRAAGEYEFALREPLSRGVQLAATQWEAALKAPALIWYQAYLGVAAEPSAERSASATGQWVHRWLGAVGSPTDQQNFVPFALPGEIRKKVSDAARHFRERTAILLKPVRRPLPDWWLSSWMNAAYLADCFAAKLGGVSGWTELATEWRLQGAQIVVSENEIVTFRGRADLILARTSETNARELWVVDYKTGNRKTLRPARCTTAEELHEKLGRNLRGGEGVQLALYALALQSEADGEVGVSLLSPALFLDAPQLHARDFAVQENFWRALARMQATGIFGMRGPVRSEFNFNAAYPLATLPIDPDLLETKWALTHPDLVRGPEELDR